MCWSGSAGKGWRHADGRLELFARGDDDTPWFIRQDSIASLTFSSWARHTDVKIAGKPALAISGSGLLHAFARGTDGALW